MALTVDEIMNRELFSIRPSETVEEAIQYFRVLGISSCPVVETGRLVGVVSVHDLLAAPRGDTVRSRMTVPPISVSPGTPLESAGRLMAEADAHHLVVVDDEQSVVGFVSSLDVIRALLGMPSHHPAVFPHYDARTGVTWSDDRELSMNRVESAPSAPGIIVLIHGGAGRPERLVWAERTNNARQRLIDLLTQPLDREPPLRDWLREGNLRFRTAASDEKTAARVVDALQRAAGYPRV